ncbi:MAG: CoA transferase [Burkholderiales bacterium]|nr:CoA transferase [Burkholderiales bacterium]
MHGNLNERGPLQGLKVLDISNIIAGPFAAAMLGDFGAEVVKVEMPGTGDALRTLAPHKDGKSLLWKAVNRNKRAITLDLRKPEGQVLFKRLLPRFDVLVENYRPGTLDGWGLDSAVLWSHSPGLIILRATGFGQTGPYRRYAGFARLFEAYSGLVHITGEKDGPPMHAGYPIADPIGGIFGAFGVLAALVERLKNPDAPGQEIDLSLTEATMRLLEVLPIEYDQLGIVHERIGNDNAYVAPANMFRTKDGQWVTFTAAVQNVFERFCSVIGREDLVRDPRFASNAVRMLHVAELNLIVAAWIADNTRDAVIARLADAGVSVAPVLSNKQIAEDPHFVARNAVTRVKDEDFGAVAVPCVVPRLSRTPGEVRTAGPAMGAHNSEVYGEWLELSETEMLRLCEAGVI